MKFSLFEQGLPKLIFVVAYLARNKKNLHIFLDILPLLIIYLFTYSPLFLLLSPKTDIVQYREPRFKQIIVRKYGC